MTMRQSDKTHSSFSNGMANFFTRHARDTTASWRKISHLPQQAPLDNNSNCQDHEYKIG